MRLIVASIPRCGSTYLFRSLAGLGQAGHFPREYAGEMRKTHFPAPKALPPGYRAVFLFGDVLSAVVSTRRSRNDRTHFANCSSFVKPDEVDLYGCDWLNYEAIFDSWTRNNGYPVLAMRYETLPGHVADLEAFLGRPASLLPWRPRTTAPGSASPSDLARARKAYAGLIAKVSAAPDCKLFS